tara:strand:+ start:222 stop:446 length:225 start_codon:yes stop_codon:yes gene_type:complete
MDTSKEERDITGLITRLMKKGWTYASLAHELDVHWLTVNRWHKGKVKPIAPSMTLMALKWISDNIEQAPPRRRS